jgi:WD40 repeat protein
VHKEAVWVVAFSSDGKYVGTGSDKTVQVFEALRGKRLLSLDQQSAVSAVAFSPDGRHVLQDPRAMLR